MAAEWQCQDIERIVLGGFRNAFESNTNNSQYVDSKVIVFHSIVFIGR